MRLLMRGISKRKIKLLNLKLMKYFSWLSMHTLHKIEVFDKKLEDD